jgi:hypothetical protein
MLGRGLGDVLIGKKPNTPVRYFLSLIYYGSAVESCQIFIKDRGFLLASCYFDKSSRNFNRNLNF